MSEGLDFRLASSRRTMQKSSFASFEARAENNQPSQTDEGLAGSRESIMERQRGYQQAGGLGSSSRYNC
ncbi:hypothetical protein Bca4012_064706 [Brassica carinata]|uniref:Uncharacterized protein n=1 Tax=Brassica carinata TaxID=52824 RepID=A0A8X8AX22_BRACI|nr:hypothetical protein Bca52824_017199 [Brassica carinata]